MDYRVSQEGKQGAAGAHRVGHCDFGTGESGWGTDGDAGRGWAELQGRLKGKKIIVIQVVCCF